MQKLIVALIVAAFLAGESSHAQWGVGLYGGLGMCPYGYGGAPGSIDDDDDVYAAKKEMSAAKKAMDKAKHDRRSAEQDLKRYKKGIEDRINGKYASEIIFHIEHKYGKAFWREECTSDLGGGRGGSSSLPGALPQDANRPQGSPADPSLPPQRRAGCSALGYLEDDGYVSPDICNPDPVKGKYLINEKGNRFACDTAIRNYGKAKDKLDRAQMEFERAKNDYDEASSRHKEARRDAKERMENGEDDDTEGTYCAHCRSARARAPGYLETIIGAGLAVGGGILSAKTARYAIDQNSRLGWPSNPYWAASVGYPMMAYGMYGALGGGIGAGGFGCASTMGGGYPLGPMGMMGGSPFGMFGGGMGGPFGYPNGMFGPMVGAGMWNPGFGPGMGFPFGGMGGGFNPYMGGGGPGTLPFPGPGGGPFGGGPFGGGPGGPFGGGPFGGGPFGGGPGGPFGGGPFGGGPFGGGPGGPFGGGPFGGGPFGGGPFGGGPFGGGGPGGPFGGGSPYGNPLAMQYQMQFAQQYMAQMQSYMAAQQAAMQDYMYRQQTISGLQQQMYQIQMQIYSISSGTGSYGGGPSVLPYPGPGGGGFGGGFGGGTPPYFPASPYGTGGMPYSSPYVQRPAGR